MKRFLTVLGLCLLVVLTTHAQQFPSVLIPEGGNGNNGLQKDQVPCPPNTLYYHTYNYVGGFTSFTGYGFKVYDQVETTPASAISEITFYGIFDATPGRTFEITFYSDNAGLPGSSIATYTIFLAGVNTGEITGGYYQLYSYTYTLPASISLVAGDWLSVQALDGGSSWYWTMATGGDGCVYQSSVGTRCDYGDVAFCLGGGEEVPVAPWALGIGIALIGAAVVLRYRRIV